MTKTVLITGGAKRIGKAIAIDFAKKKWNIAIHYNESKDEAEKLAKEINDKGLNAFSFQADLSIGEESKKLIYVNLALL